MDAAATAFKAEPSHEHFVRLQAAVEPPRQELFRRLNLAPGGTLALVQMRGDLMRTLKEHPGHAAVDGDLLHLLRSWFNRGFLVLRRIDWNSSAVILERLIQYEAVHQITGWADLRRRLQADRRCYAFFHPTLPDEPLIFIEVALTRGIGTQIQPLIDPNGPIADSQLANAATFYSITSCQEGLQGVSFGSFLIKQVAEDLGREFPSIRAFGTLSPIPGFRHWLLTTPAKADRQYSDHLRKYLTESAAEGATPAAPPAHIRQELTALWIRLRASICPTVRGWSG